MSFGFSVGDFLGTIQLAWNLYQCCYKVARDAPNDFKLLVRELNTTHSSIKLIQEEALDPNSVLVRAGPDRVQMVKEIINRVNGTLQKLDVRAKKYLKLQDPNRAKLKRFWDGVMWSCDVPEIDGLRNMLNYHNNIMNLLLTSCGNSSLQRIEASHTKLERRISQIQGLIQGLPTTGSVKPPENSAFIGRGSKVFSATLMKFAEIGQRRWGVIGIDEWINAGRWWLLQSQFCLGSFVGSQADHSSPIWRQGYVDLLKASWILIDIIARHPQLDLLDSDIRLNVELLAETIGDKLADINSPNMPPIPEFAELLQCDLRIWESQDMGLVRNNILSWAHEDEHISFERFGHYHRGDSVTRSIILLLVHKQKQQARLVLRDQTSRTLAEFHVGNIKSTYAGNCLTIGGQVIKLATSLDAIRLHTFLAASTEYITFRDQTDSLHVCLQAMLLLFAVRYNQEVLISRVMDEMSNSSEAGDTAVGFSQRLSRAVYELALQPCGLRAARDTKPLESILHWVLENKHRALAILLLERKGICINEDEISECYTLYDSVRSGRLDAVRLHFSYGAEVHHEGGLLYAAASGGYEEVVVELLQAGVDVNFEPSHSDPRTALQAAAKGGYLAVVDRLIERGAEVNAEPARHSGRTALQAAAEGGHLAVVDRLIEGGAVVNAEPARYCGRTALQAAAGGGHLAVVYRLIERGAEANAEPADEGRTALQAAAEGGHLAVVDRLIERGAAVNAEPAEDGGRTALQAAAGGGHLAVVDRLIERGAEVNAKPAYRGRTALQAAAEGGHLAVVDRLIERGAEVNAEPASWGRTALQAAAGGGHLAVVDRLIERGAEVNAKPAYEGRTALQAAAGGGHLAVVDRLIERGAEVNAKPAYRGRTALQAAAEGGHLAVVDRLIEMGAKNTGAPGSG